MVKGFNYLAEFLVAMAPYLRGSVGLDAFWDLSRCGICSFQSQFHLLVFWEG